MALFHNWTVEDFTHTYDGVPYIFPSGSIIRNAVLSRDGQVVGLSDNLARFFAKHLAMREINRENGHIMLESIDSHPYFTRCLSEPSVEVPEEAAEIIESPMQDTSPAIIKAPTARRGRKPAASKTAPVGAKEVAPDTTPKIEEKFEGVE